MILRDLHKIWPFFLFILLSFLFFWQFFLKGLLPIPADVIVGIYFPWRDQIWNNLITGVPIKNGYLSDIVSIIYPWRIYGINLMKEGISPLWIPHALAGMPLLANFQSALLYPLNILFWIFSDSQAWSWYIILQPILASSFTYLFLRNIKLSIIASLFGAVIFSYSGFMLVWLEYGIIGHAGLWLPLILLSVDKIAGGKKLLWIFVGSLVVGLSFLAGYPQISLFLTGMVTIYILYRYLSSKNSSYLLGMIFIILGILLASAQIIPGIELWRVSIRQADPTAAAFGYGLLSLRDSVLALVPDFFGNPTTGNYWARVGYNESAFYVGIVGFTFAFFSFFIKRKDTAIFFKVILLITLLFVFQNPLANLPRIFNIPGLSSASAGRLLYLVTFCLSVLCAFGVDYFKGLKDKKKFLLLSAIFLIVFSFLWLVVLLNIENPQFQIAKRNLILPSLIFLVSELLLLSCLFFRKLRKIILAGVFLILVFDLFRFGWKYNSFSPKDYVYPETKLTKYLKENAGIDRFYGLIPQSMFILYNLSSPEGYEPLMLSRYNEFAKQINESGFQQISTGSRWVGITRHESPLLDLVGVKYMLSLNQDAKGNWDPQYFKYSKDKYEMVFQEGYSQIYENKNVLPRAFIAHQIKVANDEEILKNLMNKNFEAKEIVFLEQEPEKKPEQKLGEEKVQIKTENYFSNKISIETQSLSDGYLFLTDNDYPGWQAFIDGQETRIYRANYTFRSVFLPKGDHKVELYFRPKSFKIGMILSLTTFFVLSSLLIYEIIKSFFLPVRQR